ncbi:MAG: hypothetical protein ACFFDN_45970, partial [Candidatus Hodarchaeota archaeon]
MFLGVCSFYIEYQYLHITNLAEEVFSEYEERIKAMQDKITTTIGIYENLLTNNNRFKTQLYCTREEC